MTTPKGGRVPSNHQQTKEVITVIYQGMYELQPLYDGHKSFYGKAFVEVWNAGLGTQYALKSYGTTVATVKRVNPVDEVPETYEVRVALNHLSATTLRHVKEFLAQVDSVFKGITLGWIRNAINDARIIDGNGIEPPYHNVVYVLKKL